MFYNLGIDIGSTTIKTVLMDESGSVLAKSYERHLAKPREILLARLEEMRGIAQSAELRVAVTGSAGMGLAEQCGFEFVQEVFATTGLIRAFEPDTNAVIELGGEDAKIIFLDGTVDERMNSSCAGGTGAFIDQMAALLDVTAAELDRLSLLADAVYPIASRCGVFAKTDIQPLMNQGAKKENIAASIYQAVVDQTITGLAQGRRIYGRVLFLGGPLTFLKGLQKAFCSTLEDITPVFPEHGEYFVVFGAAHYASENNHHCFALDQILELLRRDAGAISHGNLPPLFASAEEYAAFADRHARAAVDQTFEPGYAGPAYLGIDAGSTTTKMVLLDEQRRLLHTSYRSNKGSPLELVRAQLLEIYEHYPHIQILSSAVTGYGEDLIQHAFGVDFGLVETVAHYNAARYFRPDVDFIIDIGGQDMKCFGIVDGMVDSVIINEACSSGCGSFIEAFASSLGFSSKEFAALALRAVHPVDLGSRCTVFMNSSVKEAQKNGASVEDIAAGLAVSVVNNAVCKVLRVSDAASLGHNIVVQGGTFLNDAVLRSFEQQVGIEVTRPSIAGLMGAFGAALYARSKRADAPGGLIPCAQLEQFTYQSAATRCGLCSNRCSLTISTFVHGGRFISGNRCQRPLGHAADNALPNLYAFKQGYLSQFSSHQGPGPTVGLPFVLNYYDTLPYWFTVFQELGFSVKVSPTSTRETYRKGQHTIPSDTVCYGAKLVHGHIQTLLEMGVDYIFYPRMSYNYNEGAADNHYHCPVVAYYPEVIANYLRGSTGAQLLNPFIALDNQKLMSRQLFEELRPMLPDLKLHRVQDVCQRATAVQQCYRDAVLVEGAKAMAFAREHHAKTVVLAGRPYHVDPEINHGIDRLVSELGFVVLSEDAIPQLPLPHHLRVLNQWTYHARMYNAAYTVCDLPDTELVQLVSFGCGLDAVTTDEIKEILRARGKLYTGLKIDEINNLGAVRIRLRSLLAAMEQREVPSFA